ncbi:MAG: TlpA family protein disulfide reductase [Burkholderiales bacterium]|nr:TlpA family protein disulfide reductase [Burkholderiales bacterium]
MRRTRGLRTLVHVALLLAVTVAQAAPTIDQPAPALKGVLFSRQAFDLADMRGKLVLVNFYSSYCKFCAYEIGLLESFYEAHRAEGFEVLVVGVDEPSDHARVARMLDIYNLPGTMADDLIENGFARRYPTPTAFVIDRDGILRHRLTGAKTPSHYREIVLPLLRGTGQP